MISRCSAGVSEYVSPVPPAATTAQIGCASSFARFSCRPSTSRDKSFLKGVIGKAITPESLARSSLGSIVLNVRQTSVCRFPSTRDVCHGSDKLKLVGHFFSLNQIIDDPRESLILFLCKRRNKGRHRPGFGDACQLNCRMQNLRGAPFVAQILKRNKFSTQRFGFAKMLSRARFKQH